MRKGRGSIILIASLSVLLIIQVAASQKGSIMWDMIVSTKVTGHRLDAGQYRVTWESSSPEVSVTFYKQGRVRAKIQALLKELDQEASSDAFITKRDSSGDSVLKEIRFKGKKYALVFQ